MWNKPSSSGLLIAALWACATGPVPTTAYGAASGADEEASTLSQPPGPWALQFQIARDFTFQDLQGAGVSLQRNLGEHWAGRVGLGVSTSTSKDQRSVGLSFEEYKLDGQAYELSMHLVRFSPPSAGVRLYWGGGPLGRWGRDDIRQSRVDTGLQSSANIRSETRALGGTGLFGAEWNPGSRIGALIEYRLEAVYSETKFRGEFVSAGANQPVFRQLRKGWTVDLASVRFGLSLYF